MNSRLELSRSQILRFRRKAGSLEHRLPSGAQSLQRAAWAGLQDSVPRAALLSLHARVEGVKQTDWEHASLVQTWGPRFNVYVVAANDLAVSTLGRLPGGRAQLQRAITTAERLHVVLNGERMPFGHAGRAMGVHHNSLRYAAPTGTVLLRWDGARQPVIWSASKPEIEAQHARLELARRYLHILGPATHTAFARWAGIRPAEAKNAFDTILPELISVTTPIGEAWILARDEAAYLAKPGPDAPARLLPSGDAYYLLWGRDRELLISNAKQRAALWTSRVWPGALLLQGEIAGVWRRAASEISIEPWRRLARAEREAIEKEAVSLPLPELKRSINVRWD
ncbi:DNA glycosylase AlkZ-like family protein [Silvibacterium acidisoli]|uniref:DNA glycosylase AlkZ-like family protein n=1 Tax=Acidobacteriaceae bacterium ZG23-2 TaxID=2883246 RepID=UPI00406C2220